MAQRHQKRDFERDIQFVLTLTTQPIDRPAAFLVEASALAHYLPPPLSKLPNELSLSISLLLGLDAFLLVVAGLYLGASKRLRPLSEQHG